MEHSNKFDMEGHKRSEQDYIIIFFLQHYFLYMFVFISSILKVLGTVFRCYLTR